MKKEVLVISLGGSVIIPDKPNFKFLDEFRKNLKKHYSTHKFVIVCGGGRIARKYISALRKEGRPKKELALAGMRATRMNAHFIMQFFGKEANSMLPITIKAVKDNLSRNNVVICGALRYDPKSTSDGTAARIAEHLNAEFANVTNVTGLFSSDPKKNPKAKFISRISWKEFESMTLKIKHTPGQHFVLDQYAAILIRKNKIKTYIIGPNPKIIPNIIKGKRFKGTVIAD